MDQQIREKLTAGIRKALGELTREDLPPEQQDRLKVVITDLRDWRAELRLGSDPESPDLDEVTEWLSWAMKELAELGDIPANQSHKGLFDAMWIIASTWRLAEHAER